MVCQEKEITRLRLLACFYWTVQKQYDTVRTTVVKCTVLRLLAVQYRTTVQD